MHLRKKTKRKRSFLETNTQISLDLGKLIVFFFSIATWGGLNLLEIVEITENREENSDLSILFDSEVVVCVDFRPI